MPKVEAFSPEMLKEHFDKANIKYDQKSEDHFVMGFGNLFPDMKDVVLQVMVNRDQSKNQLMIHCMIGQPVRPEKLDTAMTACNRWNAEFIYPTVFVRELTARDQNQQEVKLKVFFTKSAIDVSKGIHHEMLETFLRNSIGAARDFFNWINRELNGGNPPQSAAGAQPSGDATSAENGNATGEAPPTFGGDFMPKQ